MNCGQTHIYQDEVISLSKSIAPWVPYIELTLMGFSVAKYAYTRYVCHKAEHNKDNDDKQRSKRSADEGVVSSSNGAV